MVDPWVSVPILRGYRAHKKDNTAMMRDTTKMIAIGPTTPMFAKSQIQVYSPSGEGLLLFGVRIRSSVCSSRAHLSFPILVGPGKDHPLWLDR